MVELTPEISDFMDTVKRIDKYSNIDYITPLMKHFNLTEEQAEEIRMQYVTEIFKRIPTENQPSDWDDETMLNRWE
tara:strand:- start:909 stop:1136 length:228 start_codon:yes stop_codon:yes gene_type:complete